jgi:hypothetical protein
VGVRGPRQVRERCIDWVGGEGGVGEAAEVGVGSWGVGVGGDGGDGARDGVGWIGGVGEGARGLCWALDVAGCLVLDILSCSDASGWIAGSWVGVGCCYCCCSLSLGTEGGFSC